MEKSSEGKMNFKIIEKEILLGEDPQNDIIWKTKVERGFSKNG